MQTHQYIWQRSSWPRFSWDNGALLDQLGKCRLQQGKLLNHIATLGITLDPQAQAEVLTEETLQTAAIEGEVLDARSVRSSVARRLGLPSAGLGIDRHIDGLVSVLLDATRNHSAPLTLDRLRGWHAELFPAGYSGLHKIAPGAWRGEGPMRVVSGPVGKETIHFEAPPASRIEAEMDGFLSWWDASQSALEGIVRAAVAHFWFVTIHPFEDGNGRIARALTDMVLAQDDRQPLRYYSLSSQIMTERDTYYNRLEQCQKGDGDITAWLLWFLGCFTRALDRSSEVLAGVMAKAAFWHAHSRTQLNARQRKVVNKLLDAGQDGFEGGLTTRKYAGIAHVSRATAFREISALLDLGVIRPNPGKGRSASYALAWPQGET